MHIRQAVVTPLKFVRQLSVIDTEKVEYGGMQVVNGNRVFHNVVAKIVSRSKCKAFFNTAPCEPNGETPRVVITSIVVGRQPS